LTKVVEKTRVKSEVVSTLPSFRSPELSQPIWSSLLLVTTTYRRLIMFARNVSIHVKSNMLSDYTRTFENDILPLLRKQKGFRDEITLSNPGSLDVIAISLWENKADAEAYNTNTYPEVLKTFARVIDGTPKLHTFEAVTSTFHNVAVAA
jgi:hypothetical protein